MKTKIENGNVLTVKTGVKEEIFKKMVSAAAILKDDKNNDLYLLNRSKDGSAGISSVGLTCNTVIDGELAITMVLPEASADMDTVKRDFGPALVKAKEMLPKLNAQISAEVAAVDAIFAE